VHVPRVLQRSNIQKRFGQRPSHNEVCTDAIECRVELPVGVCTVVSRTARGR
jgi:hypothetical protein